MNFVSTASLIYCLVPLLAAIFVGFIKKLDRLIPRAGIWLSMSRIIFLLPILDAVLVRRETLNFSLGFISEFSINLITDWSGHRVWFLLVLDLCMILVQIVGTAGVGNQRVVDGLLFFFQAILSIYVLSANLLLAYAAQIIASITLFYLVRFALSGKKQEAEYISSRIALIYSSMAILGITWSLIQFSPTGAKDAPALFLHAATAGNAGVIWVWLAVLLFSVPISPFYSWYNRAVLILPEGISIALITFISAVVMRGAEVYMVVYFGLEWRYKFIIYCTGLIGCFFSLSSIFSMENRRSMLSCIPKFFFSFVLVAIGVAQNQGLEVIYLLCIFIPIFSGVILYASALNLNTTYQKIFIGIFLLALIGVPGTPIYQIFSLIGGRSLEMGVEFTIVFALIWFFYFYANIFICRRIFLDDKQVEIGVSSSLTKAPAIITSYGIFLLLFITFVTLANRGLL